MSETNGFRLEYSVFVGCSDSLTGSPKKGGFQLLDTEFIRDTFGYSNRGVMSDRRNNSKGVQIATNVDLSQWSEEEFIQLG